MYMYMYNNGPYQCSQIDPENKPTDLAGMRQSTKLDLPKTEQQF